MLLWFYSLKRFYPYKCDQLIYLYMKTHDVMDNVQFLLPVEFNDKLSGLALYK